MAAVKCPLYESGLISKHEPALVNGEVSMLFYEFDELATCVAANLHALGIRRGHRVALLLSPDWKYVVLLMGLIRLGAVACPLSVRMPLATLREQLAGIACTTVIVRPPDDTVLRDVGLTALNPDDLVSRTEAVMDFAWDGQLDLAAPATIVFTSGSSGRPRAVLHTVANHYYSARASNLNLRLRSHDRWLLSLPLYHVGGLGIVFRCVLSGAGIAVPEGKETIEAAQERYAATHLSLVPTQLYRLLRAPRLPDSFQKIQAILLGGGAVNPAVLKEAYDRHFPVFPSYGSTEMTSQITTLRVDSPPPKRFTAGLALKQAELRIADDGEILVRGPMRFAGYVDGERLVQPFDADGWFRTGDLGSLDADGYLTVVGRKDNQFISGGENIHPEEIEKAVGAFGDVDEVIVVPVASAEFGHRPVAFLKMRGEPVTAEAWTLRLQKILPRFKIPVAFLAWPAEAGGQELKPDRARLRELAAHAWSST